MILEEMITYAKQMIDGTAVVNNARKDMARRFLNDLENPAYRINEKNVEFVIYYMEHACKHIKGSLRGKNLKLERWQKFIITNLVGFECVDTGYRRFTEAFIIIPRKNGKTTFSACLAEAISVLDAGSFSMLYLVASKLDRAREAFEIILKNIQMRGELDKYKVQNSIHEYSLSRTFVENGKNVGELKIQALPADEKRADGLNANLFILDEIHAYKNATAYNVYREAMSAYDNKLLIGITTAGKDMNSFCYERLEYCRTVVKGTVKDESYFVFIAEADNKLDYTNPIEHEKANPNYGVTVNPEEIQNIAYRAQNDPSSRADFLNKNLNIYVNTLNAYFNIDEFKNSDSAHKWSLDELSRLPITWYGGVDLSRMHDLTASCLYGNYQGVDICITHAFFPVTEARRKADEDNIPLFGWLDDGWLTLCNHNTVHSGDVVNWFKSMRDKGFKIKRVGYDRRFANEFYRDMQVAGFKVKETSQRYYTRSQAFRHIEVMVKEGKFYYLHNESYEYCINNVKAVETPDDLIKYEKITGKRRIDMFDASVFACYEMLEDQPLKEGFKKWLG